MAATSSDKASTVAGSKKPLEVRMLCSWLRGRAPENNGSVEQKKLSRRMEQVAKISLHLIDNQDEIEDAATAVLDTKNLEQADKATRKAGLLDPKVLEWDSGFVKTAKNVPNPWYVGVLNDNTKYPLSEELVESLSADGVGNFRAIVSYATGVKMGYPIKDDLRTKAVYYKFMAGNITGRKNLLDMGEKGFIAECYDPATKTLDFSKPGHGIFFLSRSTESTDVLPANLADTMTCRFNGESCKLKKTIAIDTKIENNGHESTAYFDFLGEKIWIYKFFPKGLFKISDEDTGKKVMDAKQTLAKAREEGHVQIDEDLKQKCKRKKPNPPSRGPMAPAEVPA